MTRGPSYYLCVLLGVVASGCFSAARPIKRMDQGDFMIGTNLNLPGATGDPEVSAWVRVAPFDGADITGGATGTVPIDANLPGVGGFLELRGHVPINQRWRMVLDAQAEYYHLHLREDDWSDHWRATFVPYFVVELSKVSLFLGPKGAWLTGLRSVTEAGGKSSIRVVPGSPGMVFAGVSLGAEDPEPRWFFTSIGGVFDAGTVIAADTGKVEVPVSYSMSLYFGFL